MLTKFPTREFVLSERSESKDLSSHATTEGSDPVGKHVYPERPKGVEGSLLFDAKGPEPAWVGEVEGSERSESKNLRSLHRYRCRPARGRVIAVSTELRRDRYRLGLRSLARSAATAAPGNPCRSQRKDNQSCVRISMPPLPRHLPQEEAVEQRAAPQQPDWARRQPRPPWRCGIRNPQRRKRGRQRRRELRAIRRSGRRRKLHRPANRRRTVQELHGCSQ